LAKENKLRGLEWFIEELKPLSQKWGWKEMKKIDSSWVAQVHCPIPQSQKHQNIYGRDDWSKNRSKACKIQTKIFQQPQDIKKSESTSTSHKLQVSIANDNQMIKACTKDHHTRSLTWWKGIRDQTKV